LTDGIGLWDTFLISWHNKLEPPAPCKDTPASTTSPPSAAEESFKHLFTAKGAFRKPEEPPVHNDLLEHMPNDPHYDSSIAEEIDRMRSVLNPRGGESHADAVARHLNKPTGIDVKATAPEREPELHFFPFIPIPIGDLAPMAMCSRKPYPSLNNEDVFVPQNECWLSLIRNAKEDIFIQT
jgi:hypothetical protein